MLGPSMPYLSRMYEFMIFLYQFIHLPLIPHDDKPILLTYLPNVFKKI